MGGALGCLALLLRRRASVVLLYASLLGAVLQDVGIFVVAGAGRLANPVPLGLQALVLAIAVGSTTLAMGVIRHRDPVPMQVGAAGIGLMTVALFVGHGVPEAVLTILGVALLAWAHLRNLRCGI